MRPTRSGSVASVVAGSHAGGGPWRIPLGTFVLAMLLLAVAAPVAAARSAYVVNANSANVSAFDTATDETVGEPIGVGSGPGGIALTPDGSRAYVANHVSSNVSVIDTASNEVVGGPIAVGEEPLGIAIVPDQPPVAALAPVGAPALAGQALGLDASASHDSDGQVVRYDWNFGDGTATPDAGPKPAHTYSAPGAYSVTVTVTDSEGCSTGLVFTGLTASCNGSAVARATRTVQVEKRPPSNEFQIGRLHRDRRHGTVRLTIQVPGSGNLMLNGKAVRTVARTVDGPETVTLTVRPKRGKMRVLKRRGHLRVRIEVTFSPDGGVPAGAGRKLTLVRTNNGPPRHYER